jgi:hypothetical protein
MMQRSLGNELLDSLPAEAPEAVRARRDLVRINACMGNAKHAATEIMSLLPPATRFRIADLGGGDGKHLLKVATRLSAAGWLADATIVDHQSIVSPESAASFRRLGWTLRHEKCDVFEWASGEDRCDVAFANLFLHHFSDDLLRQLFLLLQKRAVIVLAIEPRRDALALNLTRLLWLLCCNRVTRHDARLSVLAGFRDSELSRLWTQRERWTIKERSCGFSSHLFVASAS